MLIDEEDTLLPAEVNRTAYRCAVGVALAAAIVLVWLSLGVGIIGKDGDPANLMYFGFIALFSGSAWLFRRAAPGRAEAAD